MKQSDKDLIVKAMNVYLKEKKKLEELKNNETSYNTYTLKKQYTKEVKELEETVDRMRTSISKAMFGYWLKNG